jgi:DNA-binding response OmpR family regulator
LAKVMIVDDDRSTVKLISTLLELDGFEVVTAGRGADVMPVAEQSHPDIFLMDYHLSDMDSTEVIVALRGHGQFANTPIVVASGLDVSDEVLAAGANRFLVKPFEPNDLAGMFNALLKGG